MKIIYFPNQVLNDLYNYKNSKIFYIISNFLKLKKKNIFFNAEATLFESFFSSKFKCYTMINFNPIYFEKNLEKFSDVKEVHRYFDFFPTINKKKINLINLEKLEDEKFLKKIDLAIFSYSCDPKYLRYIKLIKKKIPICLLDLKDDQKVYKLNNHTTKKYLKIKHQKFYPDFVFFKDIKKKIYIKDYYPLNLFPVLKFEKMKLAKSLKYNFSFIGNYRNIHMKDRLEIVNFLKKNYNDSYLNIYEQIQKLEITKEVQEHIFQQSEILVSPSGIIWDSYRHLGLYKYKKPILIPKPLIKTIKPNFTDMKNCIMYDVSIKNGKTVLINRKKLLKKLNYVLGNKNIQKKIGENYYKFVKKNHTSKNRTLYLKNIFLKYCKNK